MSGPVKFEPVIPDESICVYRCGSREKLVKATYSKRSRYLGERCYVESYPNRNEPVSGSRDSEFGPCFLLGVCPSDLTIIENPLEILAWVK